MAAGTFSWTDRFLLGYAPMDDVHREFVALVDAMLGSDDETMPGHMRAFADHARRHFDEELRLMENSKFPSLQCHADEHAAVMKSVAEVLPLVEAGRADIARSLAAELARWFPSHADYMDSALAHWLVKQQYGGAPIVLRRRSAT
jgi:hemerythrin